MARGDSVWALYIFLHKGSSERTKIFHYFIDKIFQFDREKVKKISRHILDAAFRIARASCWHNTIPMSCLRGRNMYHTSPPSHPTTFIITLYRFAFYCFIPNTLMKLLFLLKVWYFDIPVNRKILVVHI